MSRDTMSRAIVKAAQDAIRGLDTLDKSMRTVTKHFKLSDHLSAEITIDLSGLPSVEYTPAFNSHGREDRLTKQERKALVLALDEMDWRLYVESLGGDGAGFDLSVKRNTPCSTPIQTRVHPQGAFPRKATRTP